MNTENDILKAGGIKHETYFNKKDGGAVILHGIVDRLRLQKRGVLPDDFPMDLEFSSGVGGWGTSLTLERDGTFSGQFHDSDMGAIGEDYPNGTVYLCHFSGRFSDIEKVDEYSYSMTLSELSHDDEGGEEWIEDGICYVPAAPYGMEDGETFVLYLPDTPTDGLDEDFLSWWPGCYAPEGAPETLETYGLLNAKMGYGFFSDPM